ncbi:MAG: hypothetical protein II975_06795 [Bacteroidales bacterium]|nr:hypothetical protein [Bacteroidales bacterium]
MKRIWIDFKERPWWRKIIDILLVLFALAGFAIIGAWAFYQLGFTKNKGTIDKNYRYMMSVSEMESLKDSTLTPEQIDELRLTQYARLAAYARFYPVNARLILHAAQRCDDPTMVDKMIRASMMYVGDNPDYTAFSQRLESLINSRPVEQNPHIIPWMNTVEWEALKQAIVKDSALLNEAGRLTGVEPRLIAGCLIGEQIRLFNSNRETFKKYLGPVKVLSVQSQFSYGVNGIKDHTAQAVESHLKDPSSEYYMGRRYEHLLDFETENHADERYKRLVDYRNHLYSYIYTGCILHQTMLQWKRAGYDISDRPDILFTLFNVGFSQSHPNPEPQCGGSHINVSGHTYTFGAIGFDFYYSGELADAFPFWKQRFISGDGPSMSQEEIEDIQDNMSDCNRPQRGLEYIKNDDEPQQEVTAHSNDEEDEPTFTPAMAY